MDTMKKRILLGLVVVLAALLVIVVLWPQPNDERQQASTGPQGGDFVLQSAAGPVALHDYRGKVVLLYFGYTWCPDICPTSLSLMGQALRELKPGELEKVQGIFVSVDPQRDTVDRLQSYARYFHPKIIGVTGTAEQVAVVAKQYGAVYHKVAGDSADEYVVDHTAFTYVIRPNGELYKILPHGTAPADIDAAVRSALN